MIFHIHFHSSSTLGILKTHNMTSSQWLDSSVGRSLHWHRRGHGFKSHSGLNFFQAVYNCDDQSCLHVLGLL